MRESKVNQEIVDMVNKLLVEKFEVPIEKLVPESLLKQDLSLDSLDFVDMVVLIEDQYGAGIRNIDFLQIRTLGDIYKMVNDLKDTAVLDSPQ